MGMRPPGYIHSGVETNFSHLGVNEIALYIE